MTSFVSFFPQAERAQQMLVVKDLSLDSILSLLFPLWVELAFGIFFTVGFVLVRMDVFQRHVKQRQSRKIEKIQSQLRKTVEAQLAVGDTTAVIKAWRAVNAQAPTQLDTLKLVAEALLDLDPATVVSEIAEHMMKHRCALCNSRAAVAVVDVLARRAQVNSMVEFQKVCHTRLEIQPSAQINEALIGGYASAGEEKQVDQIFSEIHAGGSKVRARGYALAIEGFLKKGMLDAGLKQIFDMRRAAFAVPSQAIIHLLRTACEVRRCWEIFKIIREEFAMPPEGIVLLLEDCLKREDLRQAREIEEVAREQTDSPPLALGAYVALLKNCVLHNDLYALDLLTEMHASIKRISESISVNLILCCADTKFVRFAEEIVKLVRRQDGMTIAVYSALMKVYAYAGMYDKACDLYDQITAEGLEPDSRMYGCLMKFAVECGRTDLSQKLFDRSPSLDIQNYMSLIRAAGRDKDIDRAFQVFQKLKTSGVKLDIAAYNCLLDVCVSAGDLPRARKLLAEMRTIGRLDIIVYNTLLKGFCLLGDIGGAKDLLSEMKSIGMPPNDVSFNCLINATASKGMWREAWDAVDMMERSGIKADNYTVSIIMKAVKRTKDPKHVRRALALLDKSGLNICSDEVLLNTVLETCIFHNEYRRLENLLDSFSKSGIQPSVHSYGYLIKACSNLKRLDKCWGLWLTMVNDCALDPNDIVLGCMLDALVSNANTEEAVKLLNEWQAKVPMSTVMYATLIKGFANSRQPSRAMDMWHEMQKLQVPINNVVYNAIIDSQARMGLMDEVGHLVKTMEQHGCKPDGMTCSLIVKGYCFRGELENAFHVLREAQQNQLLQDSIIYNTFLDGCVRHNRMDLADKVLEDMEKFNVTPSNFTLGILVKMYGRRGQLGKAFEIVEEVPKRCGFKVNAQVKTCLMSACFYNHKLDSAFKVFEELRSSEEGADWKIYSSMVSGTLRHGLIDKAVAVVEEAYGLHSAATAKTVSGGKKQEMECLEQLFRGLEQRGEMESVGVPLLNRFHAAQIPISGRILSSFNSIGA